MLLHNFCASEAKDLTCSTRYFGREVCHTSTKSTVRCYQAFRWRASLCAIVSHRWAAPLEWSNLNVSAWLAFGPSERWPLAQVGDSPMHYGVVWCCNGFSILSATCLSHTCSAECICKPLLSVACHAWWVMPNIGITSDIFYPFVALRPHAHCGGHLAGSAGWRDVLPTLHAVIILEGFVVFANV